MNTKYHKELPDIVQAWNQQLKTTSYLSGVEVVLEEGEKLMKKKAAAKTATKAGKAGAKGATEGRRRRRRG